MSNINGTSDSETLTGTGDGDRIKTLGGSDTVYGGDGDDEINGWWKDEAAGIYSYSTASRNSLAPLTIYGEGGNDFIVGGNGNDTLLGGLGNDRLYGNEGNNILRGGDGDDYIYTYTYSGTNELYGDAGDDKLYGGTGNDVLDGGVGDDKLNGYEGDDSLSGGDGDDYLSGYEGDDTLLGGLGNDRLYGNEGNNILRGGDGDDYISTYTYSGTNELYGDGGNDTILGGTGIDVLDGGIGDDTLYGYEGDDSLSGGDGDDYIDGYEGNDTLTGGLGNDTLYGSEGNNILRGGDGDDLISTYTYSGTNELYGDGGNDTIRGGTGNDALDGGIGDDTLYGYEGDDSLSGGDGDDELFGGTGNDVLDGGIGDDQLYGGAGDDTLTGGAGYDELNGGAGDDTYYVTDLEDYIYDSSGSDTAIVSVSFAKIPSSIETVTYINGAIALPYWISALVSDEGNGSYFKNLLGSTNAFTYSFPSSLPSYDTSDEHATGYTELNSGQKYNAITLLNTLENFIDVSVSLSLEHDRQNNIAIALNDQEGSSGYAFYPSATSLGSDILLNNKSYNSTLAPGTFGAFTITHELGHALGLKHPFDEPDAGGEIEKPPYLQGDEDHARWTMVAYNNTADEEKLEFSELDIAAFQYIYGVSTTARTGDDTYYYDATSANFIWDGGGEDTLSATNSNVPVTIYLTPGYWGYGGSEKAETITTAGQITVNFGTVIEKLTGSAYADTLTGNDTDNTITGGYGDDTIYGGAGNDSLDYYARAGNDKLYGGLGNDQYFVSASSGSDTFIEYSNEGIDSVYSAISYSIENILNIENLFSFSNTEEGIDLTGNSLNNQLAPSDGNCVLDGGLGSDTAWYGWDYAYADCSIYIENGDLKVRKGNGSIDILKNIEYISFSDKKNIDLSTASITSLDSTYSITAVSSTADEGKVALFRLVTTGVAAGTSVAYTLSGLSASDLVSGRLTGTADIGATGTTYISLGLAADALIEGSETLSITLDEFPDKIASLTVNDTSQGPTYSITSDADSYNEGQIAVFSLETRNLDVGDTITYTLSGISESDLVSGSLTGTVQVEAIPSLYVGELVNSGPHSISGALFSGSYFYYTTKISLTLTADSLTEGAETLTITLGDSPDTTASLTVNDTSFSSYKLSAVYDSRDEGSTAFFSLVANGINAGTSVAYTISGVSASDLVNGSLNRTITTAAAGESKLISIPIRKDNLTEGTETLTITLDDSSSTTASLSVNDTSKGATYSITPSSESYDEGQSALFNLVTTNLVAGTSVAYTLSGVSASDLVSNSLTGTATVSATGTTVISLPLAADALTEGDETLTITLDDLPSVTAANDASVLAHIVAKVNADAASAASAIAAAADRAYNAAIASGIAQDVIDTNAAKITANADAVSYAERAYARAVEAEAAAAAAAAANDSATASLTVVDTSISSSYRLSAVYDSRDEGSTAYFSLRASGVDAGTVVAYTISGVSASDLVGGSLSETITTAAAGESKLISIPIRKDNLTEGTETLTITLNDSSSTTASLSVNDTSKGATYSITSGSESYDEGQSALFSLVTTHLVAGTSVAYTLSGVSASDLVSNSLTGTATVSATGTTVISLPLAADALTEGAENLTITLDDSPDIAASLTINDSSKTPVVEVTEYRTTILADKNILGPDPVLIKGLTENITKTDGVITEQFFLYAGARYDYSDIDSLITVVTRNGEFTSEFSQEIADYAASFENATYSDIVKIVGSSGIDGWLITVAGDDGNYVV